jgi:prepilin-type processing-associated H-X9-DG protein
MHANDKRGLLPVATATGGGWSIALAPYLPSATYAGARNPVWICPTNDYESRGTGSLPVAQTYAMGPGAAGLNDPAFPNDSNGGVARNITTLVNPSRAIWVMEGNLQDAVNKSSYNVIQKSQLGRLANGDAAGHTALRHGGNSRTNLAFADGSARTFSPANFAEAYPDVTSTAGWRKAAGL